MTHRRLFSPRAGAGLLLVCAIVVGSVQSQPPAKENPTAPGAGAVTEPTDKAIQTRTKILLTEYFEKRFAPIGGRLVVADTRLQPPAKVEGWTGRWRMKGTTVLQSYRAINPKREEELWKNPKLSPREIERIIANETFIKSESVAYEVELSKLDTIPEIEVTLR